MMAAIWTIGSMFWWISFAINGGTPRLVAAVLCTVSTLFFLARIAARSQR